MRGHDWEFLPHFLAVARTGSLRAAAQMLGTSYGTVNRSIQALETSYGVQLFHRSRRGFAVTEFGAALMPAAEEAEQKIIAARQRVAGLDKSETGTIRFSVTPTLAYDIIAPFVATFGARYPDIDIALRLTPEIESIPKGETDVSLRAASEVREDVVARKLFPLQIGVYASRSYIDGPVAEAGPGGAGLHWLGFGRPDEAQGWVAQSAFPKAGLRHAVADGHMRARLASEGVGLCQLPTLFETRFPNLHRVPGTGVMPGPWLWILLHSDLRRTVRIRRFVDALTEALYALDKEASSRVQGG